MAYWSDATLAAKSGGGAAGLKHVAFAYNYTTNSYAPNTNQNILSLLGVPLNAGKTYIILFSGSYIHDTNGEIVQFSFYRDTTQLWREDSDPDAVVGNAVDRGFFYMHRIYTGSNVTADFHIHLFSSAANTGLTSVYRRNIWVLELP